MCFWASGTYLPSQKPVFRTGSQRRRTGVNSVRPVIRPMTLPGGVSGVAPALRSMRLDLRAHQWRPQISRPSAARRECSGLPNRS